MNLLKDLQAADSSESGIHPTGTGSYPQNHGIDCETSYLTRKKRMLLISNTPIPFHNLK
ncbi:MAG: hypothetical protein FWB84_04460 [Candidatus Bathyarchaeota archaeon]|uniref:hypothetical protein n=1 Tax=Candidatus Bathycorpusculum sp. TaxID=2994959 RepID=UPI002833BA95|nr:hypothetical protein [Candidatus Termiticorpusculum sp.]MCL2292396.1 hypothetical protein [Candidatus Termiticorpusculum sp.]